MPFADMLEKLYERRRFGIRPGVGRVQLLLERLGSPEKSFRTVHVVGTNGKGSTSTFLASILSAAGLRTALFTSPHLISFTERFQIDGKEIEVDSLEPLLDTVLKSAPSEATFFEIVTALAALSFSVAGVDIAVMEAGMGGRSDATAALDGVMTVITPISFDHCDYLGDTIEKITAEKIGITKPGTPVAIGCQSTAVLQTTASLLEMSNPYRPCYGRDFSAGWNSDRTLYYRGLNMNLDGITPGIPGRFQTENASLAMAAAEIMHSHGYDIHENAIVSGISGARLPGRMELLPGRPRMILDGAHNPAGIAALAESLKDFKYDNLHLVIGVMADKDLSAIVSLLTPLAISCYCVCPKVDRAMSAGDLGAVLSTSGVNANDCGGVVDGIAAAGRNAGENDLILVCGSLFTVGEARAWLAGKSFEGIRG